MIVLDEQLADPQIIRSIEQWYKGKVIVIGEARPQTRITDDLILALLRRLKAPTFVTINYEDFSRRIPADSAYSVICFKLTGKSSAEVPGALRAILSRPEWRSIELCFIPRSNSTLDWSLKRDETEPIVSQWRNHSTLTSGSK
jgi:hypothetical protein